MFRSGFNSGYENYARQTDRVDTIQRAQQKSARISQATKGKKKKRKPENKGKHRKSGSEITISSGTERQGGTGYGTVNVIAPRRPNRAGAGRPPAGISGGARRTLDTAFGFRETQSQKEEKERETREARQRREAREDRIRQADIDERRRERGERQRQFNLQQQAEQRREQQRTQERQAEIRRQDAIERARQQERREDLRIREQESRARIAMEERIARQPAQVPDIRIDAGVRGPLIEQGAIQFAPNINPQFENIGNPTVNVGTDPSTRRRQRGRGRQQRRPPPPESSSSSESDPAQGGSPAVRRRGGRGGGGRTPQQRRSPTPAQAPAPARQPEQQPATRPRRRADPPEPARTAEEEATILQRGARGIGNLAQQAITGGAEIVGGLAQQAGQATLQAGGALARQTGEAIYEQLPTTGAVAGAVGTGLQTVGGALYQQLPEAQTVAETVATGAGALAEQLPEAQTVAGALGTGLETVREGAEGLIALAQQPQQEEQVADPALLESVSEEEEKQEPRQPVPEPEPTQDPTLSAVARTIRQQLQPTQPVSIAQRIRERQEAERRDAEREQLERDRLRRERVEARKQQQKSPSTTQRALLADIETQREQVNLAQDALRLSPESGRETGSGSGTDTSFVRIAQGQSPFGSGEEGLLEVGKEPARGGRPIPTQTEQAEDPLKYLEAYQQTGGDIAVAPFEEPDEPLSPTALAVAEKKTGTPLTVREGLSPRETLEGLFAREPIQVPQRPERPSPVAQQKTPPQASLAEQALRFSDPEGSGTDTDFTGRSGQAYQEESDFLRTESEGESGGSIPRSERDRAIMETPPSQLTPRELARRAKLVREQAEADIEDIEEEERLRESGQEDAKTRRLAGLNAQLRRVRRDLERKKGKQGLRRVQIHERNLVRDIGILEQAIRDGTEVDTLVTETEERFYQSPTQGGVREGTGRKRKEGENPEIGEAQDKIIQELALIRTASGFSPASNIRDAQITKKNKSNYEERLRTAGISEEDIITIMEAYERILGLKREIRVLRKKK